MVRLVTLVSSFAGIGFVPRLPGTAASFAATLLFIPLAWYAGPHGWQALAVVALVLTVIGIPAAGFAEAHVFRTSDPPQAVIDEAAGMAVSLIPLPLATISDLWWWLAALALFRLLDITKPLFINQLQRLPGGWGIMADDLAAGAVTATAVGLVRHLAR